MLQKQNFLAFTLVELIVVITIIGILSTIGFVSYSGYLTWARDSNRISQLTKLSDSLQVYSATRTLPLPDDYVEVTASGASNVIAYQGYLWVDVLETLDYTNGGQDPKDDIYFTYYLTKDRKSLQLLALMEEEQSVSYNGTNRLNIANVTDLITPKTHAATYEDRFPKVYGRKLWVLTQVDTNTPIQEITSVQTATRFDVVDETGIYVAHISDDTNDKIEGTGTALRAIIPNGSCNRIKQTWGANGSGRYTINPGWAGEILVYCDMETAGGWWTRILSKDWILDFENISNRTSWLFPESLCDSTNAGITCNYNQSDSSNDYGWNNNFEFDIPFKYSKLAYKIKIQEEQSWDVWKFEFKNDTQFLYFLDWFATDWDNNVYITWGSIWECKDWCEWNIPFSSDNGITYINWTDYRNNTYQNIYIDYLLVK